MSRIATSLAVLLFPWTAYSLPMQVDGTFSVDVPELDGPVTGFFSHTLSVPETGSYNADDVHPDVFHLSIPQFGGTTFSADNVGLDLWFTDGIIKGAILGGFYLGVNSWGSSANPAPNTPSDIFLLFTHDPNHSFFAYQIDGFISESSFQQNFPWTLASTPVSSSVPDSLPQGTIYLGALLLGLAVNKRFMRNRAVAAA